MEKLKFAAGMTGEQKRYAVEAALLLGFQTETATFPVITADGEIPVPENMEELKALWKKSTGGTPEEYESAVQAEGGNAFRVRCCGNSVNNGIRAGIQPGTVNIQIIRIFFRMCWM